MRRWVCPDCGSGVHAPDKPRMDDARRYCLRCTAKTGKLVKRTCPALDRQRADRQVKAAAKRSTQADRERARKVAAVTYMGVDLVAEAARMWRLPAIKEYAKRQPVPALTVERRSRSYTTGRAWGYRMHLTIGRDAPLAEVLSVLLHEVAHCAAPWREHHGDEWGSLYLRAARERWGAQHFTFGVPSKGRTHGLTNQITGGIRAALEVVDQ